MKQLRDAIAKNEQRLEAAIQYLHRTAQGIFTSAERAQWCWSVVPIALNAIASGKDLSSSISSLEIDLKLYSDTRSHITGGKSSSVELVPFGNSVIAHSSHRDLIQQDDRIAVAKQTILTKITAYNQAIQQFRQTGGWNNPPDFVSL